MAPAAAEMLEALEATDRVVGVGDFVREPAALARLPRVGAYNAPNVERVIELRAELFLTTRSEAAANAITERAESGSWRPPETATLHTRRTRLAIANH